MRKMNFEVGVNGKKAYDVAKEYLIKNGMIKKQRKTYINKHKNYQKTL